MDQEQIVKMGLLATGAAHRLGSPLTTISVLLSDLKYENKDKNFGNGRLVRKYFENIKMKQADRVIREDIRVKEEILKIILEDVNEWNKIFMYLVKDVYNIETIIWKELVPNDVTLNISSDFVVDDNIKNLVVVQNKNGYYPIFITDGQVKQGNQFPVFTSMLDTDNNSAVSIINDLILA